MSKNKLLFVLALVIALGGGLAFWVLRGDGEAEEGDDAPDVVASERTKVLERRMKERGAGIELQRAKVGGTVKRADDGTGIAGAVVLLSRKGIVQNAGGNPGESGRPLTAVTDSGGGWSLEGIEPGRYRVAATAAGFLPGTNTALVIEPGSEDTTLHLVLEEGGNPLDGRVTDIGGGPVEDVLVSVSRVDSSSNIGMGPPPLPTLTNEEGRYQMNLANGSYVITTWHPDYVSTYKFATIHDAPRTADIQITPAGAIEGVVLTRGTRKPVPGARITFTDDRNGAEAAGNFRSNMSSDAGVVMADEAGRFRLSGLYPGLVRIDARSENHATTQTTDVPIGVGETVTEVEVLVDEAFKISGFVVPQGDPEGGVAGVLVGAYVLQPFSLLVATGPTDSDGYFEILGVPPGRYTVGALGEDVLMSPMNQSVTVSDADVEVMVELDSGVMIRGSVSPGGQARVNVSPEMEGMSLSGVMDAITSMFAGGDTEPDGSFELGPVAPNSELKLEAENEDGWQGTVTVSVGESDLDDVRIELEPRASIAGIVLSADGAPQDEAFVEFRLVDNKPANPMQLNAGGNPFSSGVPTANDGTFVQRGLEEGEHDVIVKDGKGRQLPWADPEDPDDPTKPIRIKVEGTGGQGEQTLRVVARDGVISGVVLDGEGLPVPDAFVTANMAMTDEEFARSVRPAARNDEVEWVEGVRPEDEDEGTSAQWSSGNFYAEPPVLTDENGHFVVSGLRTDKDYRVVAEGERGGARAIAEDVPVNSDVTLNLETLAGVDGVVRLGGKPVAQYSVKLEGPSKRSKRVFDDKGKFRIDRIDPGTYEVRVDCDEGVAEAEIEVEEGARTKVELELEDFAVLEGTLVSAQTGEPMEGYMVFVQPESGDVNAEAIMGMMTGLGGVTTNKKGEFTVKKVPPGSGTINFVQRSADFQSGGGGSATYEVDAGETKDLGEIKGSEASEVPKEERGELQMGTIIATYAKRPRPPGTDLEEEDEDPEGDEDETRRLWVFKVVAGGAAQEAGIEPGDEIVEIDGKSVASLGPEAARTLISSTHLKVGQSVKLELRRDDSPQSATVVAVAKSDE